MDAARRETAAILPFAPPGIRQVPAAFPAVASAEPPASSRRRPAGVLLVEDDQKLADVLMRALTSSGFEAIMAGTGGDALEVMRHRRDIAAVVLDIMIPRPDGIEVCRGLRRAGWQGPVVLISALDGPETRRRCRSSGADAFLPKPFRLSDLLDKLTVLVDDQSPSVQKKVP